MYTMQLAATVYNSYSLAVTTVGDAKCDRQQRYVFRFEVRIFAK